MAATITVDDLAARVHMARRTFVRRFRNETGTSPMAWLTDARIDRARELLEATTEPIERIGRLTGLGNPTCAQPSTGVSGPRPRSTALCSGRRRERT